MRTRPALALTLALAVATGTVAGPAHAASHKKPKGKHLHGTYTVTAPPDPSMEGTSVAGKECFAVDPASRDDHPLSLPGPGTLHVILDSQDVAAKTDWDLWIHDAADGSTIDGSHGGTAHEETTDKFKKAQGVVIRSCNLLGAPTATVTWDFSPA